MRISRLDAASLGRKREQPLREVAVAEGRLIAWIPGPIHNPLNGSQGTTKYGRIFRAKERWRERTCLCVKDAMNRAKWRYEPLGNGRTYNGLVTVTAFVWNLFDEDGLAAALKPVVDGLVDAELVYSDGPTSKTKFVRRQVIERKHRGVEVVVQIGGHEYARL